MKVSCVVVCHRSSDVLGVCLDGLRREAQRSGVASEVVVVDHSEDAAETERVRAHHPDRLLALPNRGYAAGLNAGVAASSGEVLLLANPDLEMLDDSLSALLASLDAGFDVAGPRIVGDRDATLTYPLAEDPTPWPELRRIARRRWQPLWWRGLGTELDRAWRVWSAAHPVAVEALRGPLLAIRRESMDRLGPLDEGYFLYYEETEWLLRARRRGARLAWVGDASVVHRGGHATERLGDRREIEARSRQRFVDRNWPWWARRLARSFDPGGDRTGVVGAQEIPGPVECRAEGADVWLLAPWRHLIPSAGCVAGDVLPPAADDLARSGRWWAVAAQRDRHRWRLIGRWTWSR
jgi:GT2 family glycosyltransferase